MTREQKYKEQLIELGIYKPAFDPEIHQLSTMERDLQRALKAMRNREDNKPDILSAEFAAISSLRRDILAHRDALGLTPKALARLQGKTAPGAAAGGVADILDDFLSEAEGYE